MVGQSIPIIVGVGDFKNPFTTPEKALEPYQLMLQAIQRALQDTYLREEPSQQLQRSIDSIDVVATWSWPYQDLPGLLSTKLGVDAAHKFISDHGGNQPAKLVDEAARRIAQNKTKVAVVTGGEALASCTHTPPGCSCTLLTMRSGRLCGCQKDAPVVGTQEGPKIRHDLRNRNPGR